MKTFFQNRNLALGKIDPCSENLEILSSEICLASASNKFTACLFLDISAAYDNVIKNILLHDMFQLGVPIRHSKKNVHLYSHYSHS